MVLEMVYLLLRTVFEITRIRRGTQIATAWVAVHWVMDLPHLFVWGWACAGLEPMTLFASGMRFESFRYSSIIMAAVAIVTFTWTVVVDWSTADGLGGLAAILLAEIVVVFCTMCLAVNFKRLSAGAASQKVTSTDNSVGCEHK